MSLKIDSILKPVRTIRHGDVGMEVSHIENMPKNEDSNHTETIKHFDTEKISETEYASELPILPVVKKEAKKAKKTEKKRIMKKELVKKKEKVKKKEHITKKEQTRRIRLMESIARIIKTLSRQTEISSRPSFSKAVEAFALAYAIRMKLQLPEQVSLHEKRKIPEKGTCTKQKNEITDGHASSWLLFAIIRYLVMIREQGAVSASGAKYQAKTKKKSVNSSQIVITIPMQQHAVIFAFVPAPESQNDSVRDFADNNHAVEAHFVI
jgi:hypothetical protein